MVPGVTAAVAAPAYAGIPVTHRTMASTVTFVTGHEDPTKDRSHIEWTRLATVHGTLVFLMGMTNLPNIVQCLRAEGRRARRLWPSIRWGTSSVPTNGEWERWTILWRKPRRLRWSPDRDRHRRGSAFTVAVGWFERRCSEHAYS